MDIVSNLYDCMHCSGTGTCENGEGKTSCLVCVKRNSLPFWKRREPIGLMCAACGGIGKAEPLTERINKRAAPLLAVVLIWSLLVIILVTALFRNEYFSEILAFSSAIIGTVSGFYFSRNQHTS